MHGFATYAIALMYPMQCGAAIAVQNGGFVVGNATDVMALAYINLCLGCITDGYVKYVDAIRRIVAITIIAKGSVAILALAILVQALR